MHNLSTGSPLRPTFDIPSPDLHTPEWGKRSLGQFTAPLFSVKEARSVAELVSAQAEAAPDSAAIVDGQHVLTYRELDIRSSQLAAHLRARGVGREALVGICLERSMSMVVAALGTLKAGGAYVPLDPSYPPERLAFVVQDARPQVVVTRSSLVGLLPPGEWKFLTLDRVGNGTETLTPENFPAPAAHNLAYVIYTSGSTGTPKGVEVTHGSLLNLLRWHQETFSIVPTDRGTHLASPSFDAAVWEVWPYLTAGASVSLPADSVRTNPEALRDWLVAQGITVSFVPTPMAERLLSLPWPAATPLRFLLTGGDMLHFYPPQGLPFQLVNNYGPTESTVVATSGVVAADLRPCAAPPVGQAISGTEILILDEALQPVPMGAVGEIYIGGVGLARGYRSRPEITRERFISRTDANGASKRLYRTGDLARWLPDGQIELLGRADDQIKIRGYRIEPNEITSALSAHPSIESSLALARPDKDGEKSLVAYVVIRPDAPVTGNTLREFLRSKLPDYMLPSAFVQVDSFPTTPNGKVDRASLPEPNASNTLREAATGIPLTPIEEEVAKILATLLELDTVARDDNFFLLGGHSLMGTQLIVQIRGTFGVEVSLNSLFDNPTVGGIASEIERLSPAQTYAEG